MALGRPTDAALWWSVRFPVAPQIVMTQGGSRETLTLPSNPTRDYYSYKTNEFGILSLIENGLETHSNSNGFTVRILPGTTGLSTRVQINSQAGGFTIHFSDPLTTVDANLIGFLPSVDTVSSGPIGPNLIGAVWMPRRPISLDSRDRQPILGGVSRSLSGVIRVSNFGAMRRQRRVFFENFNREFGLIENALAAEPQNTFEQAWLDSIARGNPFEIGEIDNTATNVEYRLGSLDEPLRRNESFPPRWNVSLEAVRTTL